MKVSVALCTYNGSRFLGEQLNSILNQTLLPDEIVICDDGSADQTIEIIQKFSKQSLVRVSLHRNPERLGIIRNFQQAISLCESEFIALSDQDDVWVKDKLEKQLKFLETHTPETQVVFSDLFLVDESLKPLGETLWESYGFNSKRKKQWRDGRSFSLLLKNGNVVAGGTLLFRASFREKFQQYLSADYKAWLHDGIIAAIAAKNKCIDFIDEPLVYYRQHSQQATVPYKKIKYSNEVERYSVLYGDFIKMGFKKTDLRYFGNMLDHVKFRANLPAGGFDRFLGVLRELISFRYLKYSRSLGLTALKDLIQKKSDRYAA